MILYKILYKKRKNIKINKSDNNKINKNTLLARR